ncbi:transposase [Methylobacterium radiotolerans]|uniref:transposase n=1 Tax=Methylobacterium radiotolerans TaxID=31998 RepID=UPI0038CFA86A
MDLGVEALATLSTGDRIANIRPASRREREIRRLRRALTRCRKGSNRRRKVRAKRAYPEITSQARRSLRMGW